MPYDESTHLNALETPRLAATQFDRRERLRTLDSPPQDVS